MLFSDIKKYDLLNILHMAFLYLMIKQETYNLFVRICLLIEARTLAVKSIRFKEAILGKHS